MTSHPYSSMSWIVAAGCVMIATCCTAVVCVAGGLMNHVWAIALPALLLASVAAGVIFCALEPYRAVNTDEGKKMTAAFSQDTSLLAIAHVWTDRLYGERIDQHAGSQTHPFFASLVQELARHRFVTGDEPGRLACQHRRWWHLGNRGSSPDFSLSPMLARAVQRCGEQPSHLEPFDMRITPIKMFSPDGGFTLLRGHRAEYPSRFGDSPDTGLVFLDR